MQCSRLITLAFLVACGPAPPTNTDFDTSDDDDDTSCSPVIPANINVYIADRTVDAVGDTAWICPGVEVVVNGSSGLFYVDSSAGLTENGGSALIYGRANSNLVLNGEGTQVFADPSATVTEGNTGQLVSECPGLSFDYTNWSEDTCI